MTSEIQTYVIDGDVYVDHPRLGRILDPRVYCPHGVRYAPDDLGRAARCGGCEAASAYFDEMEARAHAHIPARLG
jgi:hypothetical protein